MKSFLKVLGMAAAGGAISGVATWGHGVDPQAVGCTAAYCTPFAHQIGVAAAGGALAGVIGLFTRRPQDQP